MQIISSSFIFSLSCITMHASEYDKLVNRQHEIWNAQQDMASNSSIFIPANKTDEIKKLEFNVSRPDTIAALIIKCTNGAQFADLTHHPSNKYRQALAQSRALDQLLTKGIKSCLNKPEDKEKRSVQSIQLITAVPEESDEETKYYPKMFDLNISLDPVFRCHNAIIKKHCPIKERFEHIEYSPSESKFEIVIQSNTSPKVILN